MCAVDLSIWRVHLICRFWCVHLIYGFWCVHLKCICFHVWSALCSEFSCVSLRFFSDSIVESSWLVFCFVNVEQVPQGLCLRVFFHCGIVLHFCACQRLMRHLVSDECFLCPDSCFSLVAPVTVNPGYACRSFTRFVSTVLDFFSSLRCLLFWCFDGLIFKLFADWSSIIHHNSQMHTYGD